MIANRAIVQSLGPEMNMAAFSADPENLFLPFRIPGYLPYSGIVFLNRFSCPCSIFCNQLEEGRYFLEAFLCRNPGEFRVDCGTILRFSPVEAALRFSAVVPIIPAGYMAVISMAPPSRHLKKEFCMFFFIKRGFFKKSGDLFIPLLFLRP